MGLFDFVKEAGHRLLNDMGDTAKSAASNMGQQVAADNVKKHLDKYNIGTENVNVKVDGDKALLSGEVTDQASLEKAVLAVGNLLGISHVNASELKVQNNNTSMGGKNSRFYEVKRGDSLWQIAESVYGAANGDKYKVIFEANKPMLSSPDDIFPGQMLRIPNIDAA
ncbi:MAG: peptidoglycan-binding protein LysM [Alphaproteobacteria bacterium]|nr:peptidoglycan-binding protein LysM [Alphaproteobacteria bacterium]